MAYENRNAAYDLSLFDEELTNASVAPERSEEESTAKRTRKSRKNKVVTLPENEINKIRRRKHNPFKIAVGTLSAAVVTFVIGVIIVGQVQLTELNQQIISAQNTLADTQSIYTQNQMKVEANLSHAEIEKYATETLGMTKASGAQKEFVAIEEGDKAEVSATDNGNIFTRFFESIFNLWS